MTYEIIKTEWFFGQCPEIIQTGIIAVSVVVSLQITVKFIMYLFRRRDEKGMCFTCKYCA